MRRPEVDFWQMMRRLGGLPGGSETDQTKPTRRTENLLSDSDWEENVEHRRSVNGMIVT